MTAEVLERIVKAYDIRGLVDTELTPTVVRALGSAVADVVADERATVMVGHDMRPSAEVLVPAFCDGLTSRGVDVILIGLVSTDQAWFASGSRDLPTAMFTASHNPAGHQGIKLSRAGAVPVSIDTGLAEIRDLAAARLGEEPAAPTAGRVGTVTHTNVDEAFAAHVRSFIDEAALSPMRIAVDAGNGMAGHVVPLVFDDLPIAVDELYFELDGSFPNHPANPLEEANIADLSAHVVANQLPLGLAFDGDADRMFAVDEQGRPVSSSLVGAVVATRLLERNPGATVLHNLICSQSVPAAIERAGGTAIRTRVGHSFIKARMAETGAVFAVEHSGHYYFRDFWRADSGLVAALLLLEAVSAHGGPLSAVIAPHDRYANSGERNFTVADTGAAVDAVDAAFADQAVRSDREDGLTIVFDGGWFNLRPSNTEPLLRLNVEADDEPTMRALVEQVAAIVMG